MYLPIAVKVPVIKGKIVRRTKGKSTYVLYEIGREYDAKRQFNVPKRVVIGKLVPTGNQDTMNPNENFLKYFPQIPVNRLEAPRIRSNTLHIGAYIVFSQLIREYQLADLLEEQFGERAGLILDLASYMIINEDNAAQYYPDYGRSHPLFTPGMAVLSDSTISRFLSEVDKDSITGFLDAWNEKQDHSQKIYISYDSTNKNTQAGDLDFAEFGFAKDDRGVPIFNLSLAYDKSNRVPLFYEEYPGSINDVSQLRYMVDKAVAYHYRGIGFICDRGYFSKGNIEYLDKHGFSFLLMVKGCKPLVSALVDQYSGQFEINRSCRISGTGIYGTTIKQPLYSGDGKDRYFHLCYSSRKMSDEREQLEHLLERMTNELKKFEGRDCGEIGLPYSKYFNLHYLEKDGRRIFLFAEEKAEVIQRELKLCGYFCMVSSEKMTAEEAYRLYSGRDASEKLFRADKSFLGSTTMRAHSNEAVSAKIFIEFIALIIRNRFYNLLKEEMRRLTVRKNYMTVPAALRELEKVEMTRRSGSAYQLDFALTKNQKAIFRAFGLSADDVEEHARKIAVRLAELGDGVLTDDEQEENEDAEA